MTKKRGRPKRESVDLVRGMLWFHRVARRENKSAYALEKLFSKDQFKTVDGVVTRPCLWDKYSKGQKLPSKKLVAKVEKYYPGTEKALNHEIWSLFREELPSYEKLKIILSNIRPTLVKHIGEYPKNKSRYPLDKESSILSLGKVNPLHYVDGLSTPLDQFMGLMAIMIDGAKKGNPNQCNLCAIELIKFINLIAFHHFHPIEKEFISLFEKRFLTGTGIILPKRGVSINEVFAHNICSLLEENKAT